MRRTVADSIGVSRQLKSSIVAAIRKRFDVEIDIGDLQLSTPPDPSMGDVAMPCFPLAKQLKQNPAVIAERLAASMKPFGVVSSISSVGPYINFSFAKGKVIAEVCGRIVDQDENYGQSKVGAGKRVMIEYSGPNSNKALHIGHLRNNQIGLTLVNIFRAVGYQVIPVNIVNDRGIAICQSMVAYQKWGESKTPEQLGIKGDHFVGQLYASFQEEKDNAFSAWLLKEHEATMNFFNALDKEQQDVYIKDFESQSELVQEAYDMLKAWENNDPEVRELWSRMNGWVYDGFDQTYARQGVVFDKVYYESDTYELGRDIILKHLEKGDVVKDAKGNIVIDLSDEGLDQKVLVRSDGTTVYMTQDVGTAVLRFGDYDPLDYLVYVVANEQNYHFQVLFKILKRFGYPWADRCFHLSYGMVNMPSGKVSSRKIKEGGIFLADDLMDHLHQLAVEAIKERNPELAGQELEDRAEIIAQSTLKYFLLSVNPGKNMIFNPEESLVFEGNTGPYLQSAHAKICSILIQEGIDEITEIPAVLESTEEMELAKLLTEFASRVEESANEYNPAIVAAYAYDVAKALNKFYNRHKVRGGQGEVTKARLALIKSTAIVLRNSLGLLGIEALERM